ncbi:DUF1801 domain-containing protein [Chryseobacterium geocarposphaerae]|uniref:Uncharacterized protein YdhG (YjbR/CyaY superfamily) n=1 Tax=Chryseobacterium geocarposphaerae TaxID=1416776 RepID=A0A2M9C903_9FLAO|nr:DUF1801 domain-containing protein [Chryseobacterium geocarposphaerae]PJJ67242.1 uncharacterized protein YdhG (YjbR/CyaY superfamily) [Chryseobacterium geocarposphaerae]
MNSDIQQYIESQTESDQKICLKLSEIINENLIEAESKIWHAHPVWFLDGNPIVGYSKQKKGVRLMFWSGKSFNEELLNVYGGKFQDASVFYNDVSEINVEDLKRYLEKSEKIQWDYKNIVKRKGQLIQIKK